VLEAKRKEIKFSRSLSLPPFQLPFPPAPSQTLASFLTSMDSIDGITRPVTPPSDDESLTAGAPSLVASSTLAPQDDSLMRDANEGTSSNAPIQVGEDSDEEGDEENNNNNISTAPTSLTARRQTRGKQGAGGAGASRKMGAGGFASGLSKMAGAWGGSKGKGRVDKEEQGGGLGFLSGGAFDPSELRGGGGGGGGREEREKLVDEDEMDSLNRGEPPFTLSRPVLQNERGELMPYSLYLAEIGDPFDESELNNLSRFPPQPSTATTAAPSAPTPPPGAPVSALSPSSQPPVAPVA